MNMKCLIPFGMNKNEAIAITDLDFLLKMLHIDNLHTSFATSLTDNVIRYV